jgi:hypothetical protein
MGLFGNLFGYNQRTFEKNELRFCDIIRNMMDRIGSDTREISIGKGLICKNLSLIAETIQCCEYHHARRDIYKLDKRVDEEIFERLTKMDYAMRCSRYISFCIQSWFLFDCVVKGRYHAINTFSADDREAGNEIAESAEKIYTAMYENQKLVERQEEILALAAKSDQDRREKYRLEYDALDERKRENNEMIKLRAAYCGEALRRISPDMLESATRDISNRYPTFGDYFALENPSNFIKYLVDYNHNIVDFREVVVHEDPVPPWRPPLNSVDLEEFAKEMEKAEAKLKNSSEEPDEFSLLWANRFEDEVNRNTDVKETEKTESGLDDSVDKPSPFQIAWAKYIEDEVNRNTNS